MNHYPNTNKHATPGETIDSVEISINRLKRPISIRQGREKTPVLLIVLFRERSLQDQLIQWKEDCVADSVKSSTSDPRPPRTCHCLICEGHTVPFLQVTCDTFVTRLFRNHKSCFPFSDVNIRQLFSETKLFMLINNNTENATEDHAHWYWKRFLFFSLFLLAGVMVHR